MVTVTVTGRPSSDAIRASGSNAVIVDLSGLPRIDSTGLAELLKAQGELVRAGGRMAIIGASDSVRGVFRAARVDTLLECYSDEEQARASFSGAAYAAARQRLAEFLES